MPKIVSNEKLLEALIVHGSAGGAATALGLSRNAVYKRLQDGDFRRQYDQLQGTMLSVTASQMVDGLGDAVNALLEIIRDKDTAASVRVNAASALLQHTNRYIESASILRRLDELEAQMQNTTN